MSDLTKSETDTTPALPNDTIETGLAKLNEALAIIQKNLPAAQEIFDPIKYWVNALGPDDVILEYKIVAHKKEGALFEVTGMSNMPRLFDESMLPESPSNFESTFNSCVVRPVLNAFMKHMRVKVEEFKKQTNINVDPLHSMLPDTEGFLSGSAD